MKHAGFSSLQPGQVAASRQLSEVAPSASTLGVQLGAATPSTTIAPNCFSNRSLKATLLSIESLHAHGALFSDYLRARKRIFVDQNRWVIPTFGEFEFDQYDTPASRWIAIHEYGEVLAGIRLLPTTTDCGMYSYMIRDAQLGLIPEIPRDVIVFPAPRRSNVIEASRIFVAKEMPSARRLQLHTFLFDRFQECALAMGASHALGIVPKAWARWIRRLGHSAVPAGPQLTIGGEVCQAVIFNLKGRPPAELRAARKRA